MIPSEDEEFCTSGKASSSAGKQLKIKQSLVMESIVKVLVLGSHGVGKSHLIRRLVPRSSSWSSSSPTIGPHLVQFRLKTKHMALVSELCPEILETLRLAATPVSSRWPRAQFKPVILQFWEIPDAELEGPHLERFMQGISGVLLLVSSCSLKSIDVASRWQRAVDGRAPILLIAPKFSRISPPLVSSSLIDRYCQANSESFLHFMKLDLDSDKSIETLYRMILPAFLAHLLNQESRSSSEDAEFTTSSTNKAVFQTNLSFLSLNSGSEPL